MAGCSVQQARATLGRRTTRDDAWPVAAFDGLERRRPYRVQRRCYVPWEMRWEDCHVPGVTGDENSEAARCGVVLFSQAR